MASCGLLAPGTKLPALGEWSAAKHEKEAGHQARRKSYQPIGKRKRSYLSTIDPWASAKAEAVTKAKEGGALSNDWHLLLPWLLPQPHCGPGVSPANQQLRRPQAGLGHQKTQGRNQDWDNDHISSKVVDRMPLCCSLRWRDRHHLGAKESLLWTTGSVSGADQSLVWPATNQWTRCTALLEMEAEDWQMCASSGQRYLLNKEPIALFQNVDINQGYILS